MESVEGPSRTAQGAAIHRAAHQLFDHPRLFDDPLALSMIGREAERELRAGRSRQAQEGARVMRAFLSVRSRLAEDILASAFDRGIRQYVLVGAGLDTFAYRVGSQFPGLAVFEMDQPATQAWKRQRLCDVGVGLPANVHYMAVDFEREPFSVALRRGGFRTEAAAVFAWLGVVPYLTRTAAMQTLRSIAQTHGNEVVFDYADMASPIDARSRAALEELSRRVANAGEPFRSSFEPQELAGELRTMGFTAWEDWDAARLNARYFERRTDGLRLGARGHIMHARV